MKHNFFLSLFTFHLFQKKNPAIVSDDMQVFVVGFFLKLWIANILLYKLELN